MHPGNFRGCSRGVFGLSSWEPLRKPGEPVSNVKPMTGAGNGHLNGMMPERTTKPPGLDKAGSEPQHSSNAAKGPSPDRSDRVKLMAKYSYTANPESPLGVELTFKQKDTLYLVDKTGEHWWIAENEQGDVGHVPASYVMVQEKVTSLPWLQNRQPEVVETPTRFGGTGLGTVGKYVSSYEHKEIKEMEAKKYYCEVCDKQLNGPQPYKAHMYSKAHKEAVEYYSQEG